MRQRQSCRNIGGSQRGSLLLLLPGVSAFSGRDQSGVSEVTEKHFFLGRRKLSELADRVLKHPVSCASLETHTVPEKRSHWKLLTAISFSTPHSWRQTRSWSCNEKAEERYEKRQPEMSLVLQQISRARSTWERGRNENEFVITIKRWKLPLPTFL